MKVNHVNKYVRVPRVSSTPFNKFPIPWELHTTFNAGKLVPVYCKEVYPNTRVRLRWNTITRLLTPKYPTMDRAYLDVFFFFVPNIEIWENFKAFFGENNVDYWTEKTVYTVPQQHIPLHTNGDKPYDEGLGEQSPCRQIGDLADYLGAPVLPGSLGSDHTVENGQKYTYITALPFRAYVKIWNDWFRDENFQEPCKLSIGGNNTLEYPKWSKTERYDDGTVKDYVKYAETGAVLCPVGKYKDYFTSLLPSPQKGDPVSLPIAGAAPVFNASVVEKSKLFPLTLYDMNASGDTAIQISSGTLQTRYGFVKSDTTNEPDSLFPNRAGMALQANLSQATSATVEQLRLAFATQRFLEMSAVGGTRYVELVAYMFGANCPDEYLHRSKFLGGKSVPINVTPITQLSGSANESLGQVGAFSSTSGEDLAFDEKFEEHGYIMGLVCVRTVHSYSQGIPKYFMKKNKLDYYFPVFAHLGEQPVYNKEIFIQGNVVDDEVMGYQEAWDELRHTPSRSSAYLRMGAPGALEQWTYADKFDTLPVLGKEFIEETKENIARSLSVTEYVHQFISHWAFLEEVYQILPLESQPKLIG